MFSMQHIQNELDIQNQVGLQTHKASFRYTELDIEGENKTPDFTGKKALLFVSVGQAYHEQGKFLATIELVNKYAFKQCDIVMADTLQRHNHIGRMGAEKAAIFSKEAGDLWLKRSEYALNKFNVPHNIIRWDEFLLHKEYDALKEEIVTAYNENEEYKNAIDANVMTYIERLSLINPATDVETLFKHGLNYLIEECPIVIPLWAKMGYDYIIYPKPLTIGMAKTRELFLPKDLSDKCQWIYLRFKKK
jgi:tRNA-dependent cyclodipeptide synthase